jgi:hypothetical protein
MKLEKKQTEPQLIFPKVYFILKKTNRDPVRSFKKQTEVSFG